MFTGADKIFSSWWGDYFCRSLHEVEELTSEISRRQVILILTGFLVSLKDEEKVEIVVTTRAVRALLRNLPQLQLQKLKL